MSSVSASVTRRPRDELGLLAQPGHELADLGPAAVDDDRAHAHRAHEHDVGRERRQRLGFARGADGAGEGVAAVLDDDDAVLPALDVRQRLDKHRGACRRRSADAAHEVRMFSSM